MKLYPINTGLLRIPVSEMFLGKPEYSPFAQYPIDNNGCCPCSIQSLLVVAGSHVILIDTGVGDLVDTSVLRHYDYVSAGSWGELLAPVRFSPEMITDVILTHLHFDHCGGCLKKTDDKGNDTTLQPVFSRAICWLSREQWHWAQNIQEHEPDSFYEHTFLPLSYVYPLKLVEKESEILPGIHVRFFQGHTRGLMIPVIESEGETVVFASDLIPTTAHLPVDCVMAYDRDPCLSRLEKRQLLTEAKAKGWTLFLQHDNYAVFEKEF